VGHKRKGQLTTDIEWHKHLRKIGKRFFWKGERIAEKKMVNENLSELNNMTEIPMLTFDKLFDLVEENLFENKTDKKIVEKILEAENDWGDWKTSVNNLNEFILVLEKEINGITTQSNLEKLLNRYNRNLSKYAWEAESLCSLLEIFKLTEESELRIVFLNIANKNKTE
jgi:hypothetical protein